MKNYRLWLVLSCAALAGLWYVLMALLFLGMSSFLFGLEVTMSSTQYNHLLIAGTFLSIFAASALTLPFALAVFKRLKIEKPLLSGAALISAFVFVVTTFIFATDIIELGSFPRDALYALLAVNIVFAALVYGFAIRPLKHKLSTVRFLIVSIGLALLPAVLYVVHRLVVINSR